MPLTKQQQRALKAQAHSLKPVVMVGNKGITESLLKELDLALEHHELIKVKIAATKEDRLEISQVLCQHSQAELIGNIGQMAILYREASDD